MFDDIWFYSLFWVFLAGLLRGFSGFGAGMVLVPGLSILYDPVTAVITVVLLEVVPSFQMFPSAVKQFDRNSVLWMSLSACIGIPIGALILLKVDQNIIQIAMALLILFSVIVLLTGWRYMGRYNHPLTASTGLLSGIISGATSLGGLPVILYYLSGKFTSQVARASMVMFLVSSTVIALIVFLFHGMINKNIIISALSYVPVFILAIFCGGRLFGRVPESVFRSVTLTLLGGVSLSLLIR